MSPGFEREVEGFARLHKLRFEAVPVVRWEEAIPMLLRQDGDVLGGMSITPERRKRVDFSVELLPARSIVVTRRPGAGRTLAELRSARVAIVPNTTWAEALEKAGVPASRAVRVADISAAVEAIQTGHADATVTGVVDFLLQRRKHRDLEAGLALGEALSSAWAVRKGCPRAAPGARRVPGGAPPQPELEPAARELLRGRRPGHPRTRARVLTRIIHEAARSSE